MLKRYHQLMLFLLKALDVGVVAVAWVAVYFIRCQASEIGLSQYPVPPVKEFIPPAIFSLVFAPLVFSRFELYFPKRTKAFYMEFVDIARAVAITWAVTYVFANLSREVMISRFFMVTLLVFWMVLAILSRLIARSTIGYLRSRGMNLRHAAIVGTGRLAQKLFHSLQRNPWIGIDVQYFIDDSGEKVELLGRKIAGPVSEIDSILTTKPVDVVFVALPTRRHPEIEAVLNQLSITNADIKIIPDLLSHHFLRHDISQLDGMAIISLTHSPSHGWGSVLKRGIDIVLSVLALIIFAVPMLVIALSIKLTAKGPVFYRQRRSSLGGRGFYMIKFCTMIVSAENNSGAAWTTLNDSRITPIGKFLRRTSLDELPQLFNVLVGHMSLVGPRPERPELIERFRTQMPRYMLRGQIKAGMTGWAQIHGYRGNTSLRKRIQYDLHYICNWSLGLDIWTLFLTLFRGFIHNNAY